MQDKKKCNIMKLLYTNILIKTVLYVETIGDTTNTNQNTIFIWYLYM